MLIKILSKKLPIAINNIGEKTTTTKQQQQQQQQLTVNARMKI
jgi:hypothetical protein